MKVEVIIKPGEPTAKVTITASELNKEINELLEFIGTLTKEEEKETEDTLITGFIDEKVEIIDEERIMRIYSSNSKTFICTPEAEYRSRLRLYEFEDRLENKYFVRISKSEIINLHMVKSFDLGLVGTICVRFVDGSCTYVSRRFVSKIKGILNV